MSGRRNEPARARHREDLKKKLSLTSMRPGKSEHEVKLNLANHFGWQVLGKTQVDGQFPHLTQYFEKPDIAGKDFQKVTYVLYMDCKDMDAMPKTTSSTHKVKEVPSREKEKEREREREEKVVKTVTPKPSKKSRSRSKSKSKSKSRSRSRSKSKQKGKLISDFYYTPRERSRSPKRTKSKDKRSTKSDDSGHELKETKSAHGNLEDVKYMSEDEREKYLDELCRGRKGKRKSSKKRAKKEKEEAKEKAKKEVEKHRKKGHDSWALRAGADSTNSDILMGNKGETVKMRSSSVVKKDLKLIKLVNMKPDPKRSRRALSTECLFESPSGTNKYLYVAKSSSKQIGAEYKMKAANSSGSNISS